MAKQKVPNLRNITVNKLACNKNNLYTTNNLKALDRAASTLKSVGGFKLYMYLAKNQDKYNLDLYSSDFFEWSSLSNCAYTTAFNELVAEGYLVQKEGTKDIYYFYDYPCEAAEVKKQIKAADDIPVAAEEFIF